MKNITVFLVLVITSFPIFGESPLKDYSLSVSQYAGFVYGQALELVYQNPNGNDKEFLSELKWDMKPVFYLGLQLDFGRTNIMSKPGFFSTASFKVGSPDDTGYIENRDWQSNTHSGLTDYSKHTNKTREFLWLDAAIGVSIPVRSILYIKPFISGSWMRFAFTGRDGYGEYPPDASDPSYLYIDYSNQNVITYKQDWFLLAAGITIGMKNSKPLSFEFSFKASPFTYCAARDDHLSVIISGRKTPHRTYLDFTNYGLFLEPSANVSYSIDRLKFSLELAYRHIGKTLGDSYYRINNSGTYLPSSNKAGAGLSVLNTKFIVTIQSH